MPLVTVMMALALLTGLAAALVVGTMTETAVAATYQQGAEAFYAAEGVVEFAVGELAREPDWEAVVSGAVGSAFVDGPPGGPRQVGRATIELAQATADVDALAAAAAEGPLSFQLYAYGWFADLVPGARAAPLYVCVWVAEIPGGLRVVGRAYGPTGAQRSVAALLARLPASEEGAPGAVEVLSWQELR